MSAPVLMQHASPFGTPLSVTTPTYPRDVELGGTMKNSRAHDPMNNPLRTSGSTNTCTRTPPPELTGLRADSQHGEVISSQRFDEFFQRLVTNDRRPLVVLSIAEDQQTPSFDLGWLENELGSAVEFAVIDSSAAYQLTNKLKSKAASVFSGWLRIYPPGTSWMEDASLAPRFPPPGITSTTMYDRVVERALSLAYRYSKNLAAAIQPIDQGLRTEVEIESVVGATRAIVHTLEGRRSGLLDTTKLFPGVSAERLVRTGQRLNGNFRVGSVFGEFTPDPSPSNALRDRILGEIGDGCATLAYCECVTKERAQLAVVPGVTFELEGERGQDLQMMLSVGDTVSVEIVEVDGTYYVSLLDEETPELSSFSILPGGPPWLVQQRTPIEPQGSPLDTSNGASAIGVVESEELLVEVVRLEDLVRSLGDTLREERRRTKMQALRSLPQVYADPERQFRFEVELTWLASIDEPRRESDLALAPYRLGRHFLDSVDAHIQSGGLSREQVLKAVVEVACGLAPRKPARSVKAWTVSRQGGQECRADGAVAWRVRVQTGAPSARRMKYWTTNGSLEFDAIYHHDEGLRH